MPALDQKNTTDSGSLSDDLLTGAKEIAQFTGKSKRQVDHLLETRQLPAFQLGKRWHMRKSTFLKHIASQEIAVSK